MRENKYVTLVQALAKDEKERYPTNLLDPARGEENLLQLCQEWGVEPIIIYPDDGRRAYYNMGATLHELARYVVATEGGAS